jgi:hypothetical protein
MSRPCNRRGSARMLATTRSKAAGYPSQYTVRVNRLPNIGVNTISDEVESCDGQEGSRPEASNRGERQLGRAAQLARDTLPRMTDASRLAGAESGAESEHLHAVYAPSCSLSARYAPGVSAGSSLSACHRASSSLLFLVTSLPSHQSHPSLHLSFQMSHPF